MKKNILAICDREEGYVKRLMENINERSTFPFEISYFTDSELFYKKLDLKQVELGIVSESLYDKAYASDRLIAILDEGKQSGCDIPRIWKYQSSESIRKSILGILAATDTGYELDEGLGRLKKTGIISFFSPCKRCLQSSLALALAKALSADKKVLFVSLEAFSSNYGLMDLDTKRDITDLMYYFKNWSAKTILKLEEVVCSRYGFDVIPPARRYEDLYEIEGNDWVELIELIKEKADYDYVILDISESIDGLFRVLGISRCIFTVAGQDRYSKEKLNIYMRQLQNEESVNILNKTEFIELQNYESFSIEPSELFNSELVMKASECIGRL